MQPENAPAIPAPPPAPPTGGKILNKKGGGACPRFPPCPVAPSHARWCPVKMRASALDFGGGGISIKSRRPPQGGLRGHTSVFIGIIVIPTKAQVHGNHVSTRRAYLAFAILRGCACPLYRSGDVVMMSLSHVKCLTYVEIMAYGLRLKMTTPIRHFHQNNDQNKRPHLFYHRVLYPDIAVKSDF